MNNKLIILVIISIISRLFAIYFFGAKEISNEWGIMISIMEEHRMIGFRRVEGEIMPNILMPPLYPIFLYVIKTLFNNLNYYLITIQALQLLLSIVTIIYFKKILSILFCEKISYFGTYLFALFPLNIYAISQISSISLQISLVVFYIFYFMKSLEKNSKKNTALFSLYSACLILLRGEFFLFYLFTLLYFFLKKKITIIILSLLITLLLLSPYLVRNYLIFEVITITKSVGINLFKGNNPLAKAEGMLDDIEKISKETHEKIKKIEPQKKYDLIIDNLYKKEAIRFITEDPARYLKLYIIKFFSFLFFDLNSTYPNYYSILHLLPKIFISITSMVGVFFLIKNKEIFGFFALYYMLNAIVFSIFFILPRYSLSLLPIQVILTCYLLKISKIKFINS